MLGRLGLLLLVFLAACSEPETGGGSVPVLPPMEGRVVTYTASDENFLNPERGLHVAFQLQEENDYRLVRSGGWFGLQASVVFAYVSLDQYRYGDIPQSYLNHLRGRLENARQGGVKLILRHYYAFPGKSSRLEDAPLERMLRHIEQLRPLWAEYEDIIWAMQAGFIGYWGEWHSSSHGLDRPESKDRLVRALLQALPKSIPLQLRYLEDIERLFPQPLPPAQAFSGGDQARVGHHNDCFLAGENDAGTYSWNQWDRQKAYLEKITRFVPVAGETCEVNLGHPRQSCSVALAELRRFNWQVLSGTWHQEVLDRWKREGCYDQIVRRLGYRFRLVRAILPERLSRGSRFRVGLEIANDGFANPIRPRPVRLVLRHSQSGQTLFFNIPSDPRTWAPDATQAVLLEATLPSSAPTGAYEAFLHLPDPAPGLERRPEYAIRLANQGVWEASTGYNRLLHTIQVH
ncbi:DUF4832 domain-containing protein [Meiothermus sp. QL-1]|uniref:DUF4832 domain-containing protein n=1 Tax=Meiothermus sp. QL-1 TaxID=2058095 RepID=UPI001314615B|nr:DUF4832 domain-containing protein [Meiothermus sp. QL-1]